MLEKLKEEIIEAVNEINNIFVLELIRDTIRNLQK